jgi:hypothetical protein
MEKSLLVPVLDVQADNLSFNEVSFPFVNSYLDFSGIVRNKADVLTRYI